MAHGSGLPATSNPFRDFNFSYDLAKLVEYDLDPETINSKLRLPKKTLDNARKKTKDPVVINAYQFNQWYWRNGAIYTVEDLKARFNEDIKQKIEELCESGKKWKVQTARCGRPPELQIKKNGILMAYCRHCLMKEKCFFRNLTSASIPARPREMKKDQQRRQPKSATGPSKRTQSGTIYSILKSLLSKDKENMFILLNMKQLCPYLCQEGILPLVTFTKYSEKNMSAYEQSADYLENVLTRKQEECLKFLFCLQSEKEHPGHKQLLDYVLTHCSEKQRQCFLDYAAKRGDAYHPDE